MPLAPATKTKAIRQRKCKVCRTKFQPRQSFISWCCPEHGAIIAEKKLAENARKQAKIAARAVKQDNADHRARLEYSKPLSWHLNRAQRAFNAYIKARDFGKPCGCCGRPLDWYRNQDIDCGHYRTVAAAGHLRYNEDNAAAQAVYCNRNKAGNQAEYRQNRILAIGLERVEALDNDNRTHNWTREELAEITKTYRAKLKELKGKE